jgi:hypothetical protein
MGNTESNVTSGVKKQAGGALQPLYKLVDLKGLSQIVLQNYFLIQKFKAAACWWN